MAYTFENSVKVPYDILRDWTKAIYMAVGMSEQDAWICADATAMADARGVYSHGCVRVAMYCSRMLQGGTSPTAQPSVIREKGAMALVDGNNAMGQVVGTYGMKLAIEKAKKLGTAIVGIRGSGHFGTCAYYAEQALKEDMIGIAWTSGGPVMAVWGGVDRQMGNNPFCFAIPCGKKRPFVLDMAQSVVARGKLVMHHKTNTPIAENWVLAPDGSPTTDIDLALEGTLRPIGDYKGSGLAVMVSMITAVLTEAYVGGEMKDLYKQMGDPQNVGHYMQAIDIASFTDVKAFKQRMDDYIDYLKFGGARNHGVEEIFMAGEPEHNMYERQMAEGIDIPIEIIKEYHGLCDQFGVEKMVTLS